MRFAFTEEQDMLRAAARGALARSRSLGQVREVVEGRAQIGADLVAEQGWTGVGAGEEQQGQGGGLIELAIVVEELGRAVAPDPLLAGAGLGLPLLRAHGDDPALVAQAVTGSVVAVPLISAGTFPRSDACLPASALGAGRWSVSGEVRLVLEAPTAGLLLVPARAGARTMLLAVDPAAAGVSVERLEIADLTRAFGTVRLSGVAADELPGDVAATLRSTGARAAVLTAADALGACRRMLELTVDYVKQREQFGRPVGSFQAVKQIAAEMLVDVETAHSAVYHAAWSVESQAIDHNLHAAAAKALTAGAANRVADRALELHGAVGFTWEHDLHLFIKRVRADAELFGSASVQRELVAGELRLGRAVARV